MASEPNEREKWQIRRDALSLNASSVLQYSNYFLSTAPFLFPIQSSLHADMWQEHLLFQLLYFREMIWIWNDFKISTISFPYIRLTSHFHLHWIKSLKLFHSYINKKIAAPDDVSSRLAHSSQCEFREMKCEWWAERCRVRRWSRSLSICILCNM